MKAWSILTVVLACSAAYVPPAKAGLIATLAEDAAKAAERDAAIAAEKEAAATAKAAAEAKAAADASKANEAAGGGVEVKGLQVDANVGSTTNNAASIEGSLIKVESDGGEAKDAAPNLGGGSGGADSGDSSIPWWGWVLGVIAVLAVLGKIGESKAT